MRRKRPYRHGPVDSFASMTTTRFVPDDFVVPNSLIDDSFVLEPLSPERNEAD